MLLEVDLYETFVEGESVAVPSMFSLLSAGSIVFYSVKIITAASLFEPRMGNNYALVGWLEWLG